MRWDNSKNNGGSTTKGVTALDDPTCPDCIKVVLLGGDPTVDYDNGPNVAGSVPTTYYDVDRTWRVLLKSFQNNFETYGRKVKLIPYRPPVTASPACQPPSAAAVAATIDQQFSPFAVVEYGIGMSCGLSYPRPTGAYAARGIEYFSFTDSFELLTGARPPNPLFPNSLLDGDVSAGGTVSGGVPYLWSGQPSVEDVADSGAQWLCAAIIGHPVTNSNDTGIAKNGVARKIAVGYDNPSDAASAQTFEDQVQNRCGYKLDGPIQIENSLDYTNSGDQPLARAAVNTMYANADTSVVCFICGRPSANSFQDAFAIEAGRHSPPFYPEFMFISGSMADAYHARYQGCNVLDPTTSSNNDPTNPCNNVTAPKPAFDKAFGIRELWQLPAYLNTYWYRAYSSSDPSTVVSMRAGLRVYETLMQLFAAVQLAGPDLTPATVASGDSNRGADFVGMDGWQRMFTPPGTSGGASPAAGYTPGHHAFLKSVSEVRWDAAATPPAPPYAQIGVGNGGCYRISHAGGDQPPAGAPCTGEDASDTGT